MMDLSACLSSVVIPFKPIGGLRFHFPRSYFIWPCA